MSLGPQEVLRSALKGKKPKRKLAETSYLPAGSRIMHAPCYGWLQHIWAHEELAAVTCIVHTLQYVQWYIQFCTYETDFLRLLGPRRARSRLCRYKARAEAGFTNRGFRRSSETLKRRRAWDSCRGHFMSCLT